MRPPTKKTMSTPISSRGIRASFSLPTSNCMTAESEKASPCANSRMNAP